MQKIIEQNSTFSIIENSKWVPEKHLLIEYAKAFAYVDRNKQWKVLQEMGIPDHLTCHTDTEKSVWQVRKQQLELDMEQQDGSKLAKEYLKEVYCHPYLT